MARAWSTSRALTAAKPFPRKRGRSVKRGVDPTTINLFGIALDQASLRWAAAEGVTETVIAAVSLLQERSVEEITGKLTPAELADVTRLVSRCPSCYPPGAYDALKAWRNAASAELDPHTERAGLAERTKRAHDANRAQMPAATNSCLISPVFSLTFRTNRF